MRSVYVRRMVGRSDSVWRRGSGTLEVKVLVVRACDPYWQMVFKVVSCLADVGVWKMGIGADSLRVATK